MKASIEERVIIIKKKKNTHQNCIEAAKLTLASATEQQSQDGRSCRRGDHGGRSGK